MSNLCKFYRGFGLGYSRVISWLCLQRVQELLACIYLVMCCRANSMGRLCLTHTLVRLSFENRCRLNTMMFDYPIAWSLPRILIHTLLAPGGDWFSHQRIATTSPSSRGMPQTFWRGKIKQSRNRVLPWTTDHNTNVDQS